jgi:hypothetical protein
MLAACDRNNTVCTPVESIPESSLSLRALIALTPVPSSLNPPIEVEVNGKIVKVDKLVDYPLCNDNWSGVVYVGCEAQIAKADFDSEGNPLFLYGCDLNIEPGSIVYVAAHNDAAFYKGCSCHTGENPIEDTK